MTKRERCEYDLVYHGLAQQQPTEIAAHVAAFLFDSYLRIRPRELLG